MHQKLKKPQGFRGTEKVKTNWDIKRWSDTAANKYTARPTSTVGGGKPHNHSGSSSSTNHLPPYFTLAFIIRV